MTLLYGAQLEVLDFAGLSMTGTDYSARFLVDFDIASQFSLDAILADAPSHFPQFVRGDPQDRVVPVHITIDAQPPSQNLIDTLKTAFSPSGDIDFLRVRDENGNVRRMRAKSLGLVPWEGHDDVSYVASLHAPEPVWESGEPDVIFYNVSGIAGTTSASWEVLNNGNEECFPVITITPYANRAGAGGHHQQPIVIAWRSSLEGVDSQGLPYPINITDGLWDTTGGVFSGNDTYIRTWLDGVEISRYIENIGAVDTSVWCSIPFQPTRQAELLENVSGTDMAMAVTNADDLAAFPDTGFALIDAECIAYQGKTATSLLALKRAQRGTVAAAHSGGETIYWVEHDIRITYDNAIPQIPGLSLDDEKPIIDMAASTNLHHKYGTTDGLIEPDTLRTGQWVRELRAPANGLRAKYASLAQVAGVATFVDQLPEAGAPNFDSLSLYAPCFVSANVTGVALDVECDHHMLFEMYGIDVGGFESLVHRRSVCGWLDGYDTGDDVSYFAEPVGTLPFDSLVIPPPDDLARLTLLARTSLVTGLDAQDGIVGYLYVHSNGNGAGQSFGLAAPTELIEATFILQKESAFDGSILVDFRPMGTTPEPAGSSSSYAAFIANGDISGGAGVPHEITFRLYLAPNDNRMIVTGQVVLFFRDFGGTVGRVEGGFSPPRNIGGDAWDYVLAGATWTRNQSNDLSVSLNAVNIEPQEFSGVGTGRTVRYRNVDVHFNPAYTPLIVMGDDAPAYVLDEEVLTNVDTGESLVLTGVLPIETDQTQDIAKIDSSGHVLTVLRDGLDGYEQPAGYFADPTDITTWLRLLPGVNHLQYSNSGGGARLALKFYSRSRWT